LLVRGPGWDFIHQEIGSRVIEQGKPGGFRYYADGVVALDLSPKEVPGDVTVTLRRGVTVRGRLLGPNGEPVKEAVMTGPLVLSPEPATHLPQVDVHGGLFTLRGCEPGKTYPAYFLDPENRWGATVTVSGKQARTPRTVRLAPCGQATVRFLDHDGKPLRGFAVPRYLLMMVITAGPTYEEAYRKGVLACDEQYACNIDRLNHRKDQKTDDQGRFTFPALIPGATYRLSVPEENGFVVKKEFRGEAGKKLDLGDVTLSRIR